MARYGADQRLKLFRGAPPPTPPAAAHLRLAHDVDEWLNRACLDEDRMVLLVVGQVAQHSCCPGLQHPMVAGKLRSEASGLQASTGRAKGVATPRPRCKHICQHRVARQGQGPLRPYRRQRAPCILPTSVRQSMTSLGTSPAFMIGAWDESAKAAKAVSKKHMASCCSGVDSFREFAMTSTAKRTQKHMQLSRQRKLHATPCPHAAIEHRPNHPLGGARARTLTYAPLHQLLAVHRVAVTQYLQR